MRRLVFFFFRIMFVFFAVWIPYMVFPFLNKDHYSHFKPGYHLVSWSLSAIQPILSVGMVLTKYDVRKYVLDLVTLSYCYGAKSNDDNNNNNNNKHTSTPDDTGNKTHVCCTATDTTTTGCETDTESDDDSDGLRYSIFGHATITADGEANNPEASVTAVDSTMRCRSSVQPM